MINGIFFLTQLFHLMSIRSLKNTLSVLLFLLCVTGNAQYLQQGPKLVSTDGSSISSVYQGFAVAVSADGNTAVVGGFGDSLGVGATWIYTRSGGKWKQQGSKLIGTGSPGNALQGGAVSISADGNTVLVGGHGDNGFKGAAWVFVRSNGIWQQQGEKLVGTGAVGSSLQGISVSLSANGNTAIIGGSCDSSNMGAVWIFQRTNGIWKQQGGKLVGSGSSGITVFQGTSVSISADGNTAIVGAHEDNDGVGAAWIFTRSDSVWSQQGAKLVGADAVGKPKQGYSVAISPNGNTAIVGAMNDNSGTGAAFVYTRTGTVWTQQGPKLSGTGAVGPSIQGRSVSLSADGAIAVLGGELDNNTKGAAWVFKRSNDVWTQLGEKIAGTGTSGFSEQGRAVAISGDGSTIIVGGSRDSSLTGAAWIYSAIDAPTIEFFSPITATAGSKVTINGINLSNGVDHVLFGGVPATSFNVINNSIVEATVGQGATGKISIKTSKGTSVIEGFVYTVATGINQFENGEFINLFPNPVKDRLQIHYKLNNRHHLFISVFSDNGIRLIDKELSLTKEEIDFTSLPSGIYTIHLIDAKSKRKFIYRIVK
jgi:Secretion system C-terminal sorting domain/FG-GAP repeat